VGKECWATNAEFFLIRLVSNVELRYVEWRHAI